MKIDKKFSEKKIINYTISFMSAEKLKSRYGSLNWKKVKSVEIIVEDFQGSFNDFGFKIEKPLLFYANWRVWRENRWISIKNR